MALVKKRTVAKALARCALRNVDRRWVALIGGTMVAATVAMTVTAVKLRGRGT